MSNQFLGCWLIIVLIRAGDCLVFPEFVIYKQNKIVNAFDFYKKII